VGPNTTVPEPVRNANGVRARSDVGQRVRSASCHRGDRMKRRHLLGAAAAFAALRPLRTLAQAGGRRAPLAWLSGAAEVPAFRESFVRGMRELGHVEGGDYEIVGRFAEGLVERLPALAAELVQLKPTVFVIGGTPATIAAHNATATIPIVAATFSDPITFGLIESQARPG